MPLVRTYGKRKARIVQSSVWISPDVDNGHVFSSPDVDLESTDLSSPPSVEKERSAEFKNQPAHNDTQQSRSRKAKPTSFAHIFSCSEEDKENFIPEDDDTPGIPERKLLPKKNTVQNQKGIPPQISLFQINGANITRRRGTTSTSSSSLSSDGNQTTRQSGKKRKERRNVKLSRGLRKMRQDDGALCELGKNKSSASSSRSSTKSSSSWHPSGVSSTGSTSWSCDTPPDKAHHLFSIAETLSGDSDSDEDIFVKSDTPEAKRKKGESKNNWKDKLAPNGKNCGKSKGKETSTPVSSYCQESRLSPILFDDSLHVVDDESFLNFASTSRHHEESDNVFEEVANISRDMNFLKIEQDTDLSFGKIPWQNSQINSDIPSRTQSELAKTNLRTQTQAEVSKRSQSEGKSKNLALAKAHLPARSTRQSKINAINVLNQYTNASNESDSETSRKNKRKTQPKKKKALKNCEKKHSTKSEALAQATQIIDLVQAESCNNQEKSIKSSNLEKAAKISPCSVMLTKLSNLQTPPRSKQLSHLTAFNDSFKDSLTPTRDRKSGLLITAKSKVLCQCGQKDPRPFSEVLSSAELKHCVKVGEGAYGEVFRTLNAKKEAVALKIVPIEGDFSVNDEPQKTFDEILPEIVISRELSSMQTNKINQTRNFIQVNRVVCVRGSYPDALLHQWDVYNERKGSENERPDMFGEDQLFILFEFADGGKDLEELEFSRIEEAISILQQVTGALASAERQYSFEHRDLHWGNILIRKTNRAKSTFRLEGELFEIPSHGVEASIIDFTLSRLQKEGCTVFCDVSDDGTLFIGKGDYQFDIYRRVKRENKNDWEAFNPHSNVLWLHYILEKLLKSKTYAVNPSKELMRELKTFGRHLLGYSSAEEVLRDSDLLQLLEIK